MVDDTAKQFFFGDVTSLGYFSWRIRGINWQDHGYNNYSTMILLAFLNMVGIPWHTHQIAISMKNARINHQTW